MCFSVSPDGRFIAIGTPGEAPVRIVPSAGGQARDLATELVSGNAGEGIAWASDGRYVWFTRYIGGPGYKPGISLWRVAADGGGRAESMSSLLRESPMIRRLSAGPNGLMAVSTQLFGVQNWVMRFPPPAAR